MRSLRSRRTRDRLNGIITSEFLGNASVRQPILPFLFLPYARLELPGWGVLLRFAGVFEDERWRAARPRTLRGKWHGYRMTVDLRNWSERHTYFLARFYDLPTQLLLRWVLRSGDTLVDVGANIGMITLLAARLVGSNGRVFAFEPNQTAVTRLREVIAENQLENVTIHSVGLSDEVGDRTLTVFDRHSGSGTLAPISWEHDGHVTDRQVVPVARGDDLLPSRLEHPVVIKVDVEGYECRVIRGLERTIRCFRPMVLTEALPGFLARAGSSLEELYSLMTQFGYCGYSLQTRRRRFRHVLDLRPRPEVSAGADNIVWVHPNAPRRHVLQDVLREV